ncbi:MAG: alpha-rhamnosidase [Sphingobacteriales bacterium]|nr:MAG: alpha-rhamnosidase [Sphingobacteriales bacterium]
MFFCMLITTAYAQKNALTVNNLQCEYLTTPLGIDAVAPRFIWQIANGQNGAKQTAYRIIVNTGKLTVWDSGLQKSNSNLVNYNGRPLSPYTRYNWKVEVWDNKGIHTSAGSWFETGLGTKNWKGYWISDDKDTSYKPAPYFRKIFSTGKKIRSARAYITAAGLFTLSINGQKVGNHRLDPLYTRFDKRNLYLTHDVTALLSSSKNAIGVVLGNGWYNHQTDAVWDFHKAHWRNRPAFLLNLRIVYTDGTTETIATDTSWKTSGGPLQFNSIYTAEKYDARLEQKGWNTISFDQTAWLGVIKRDAPSANIVSQAVQPIRGVELIPAKTLTKINDTVYVFDLGRNIAGVSTIKVAGEAGTVLKLKHGERLYKDGTVDQSNIDPYKRPTDPGDVFQTDVFTLGSKGTETFTATFNYKGFQYVQVSSTQPVKLTKESLIGTFMHSDVAVKGGITSSDEVINKILSATNNSYLSNLYGYPTDCPQREKNGWTGDAQIAIETGLYSFDGITVYEKWMADHRDEQQPNGVLPSIIPTAGWGYEWGNGPDWTSTIAIIPWNIYLFYGDKKVLADCYENIKRYVDHIDEKYPTGLTTWGLGDWVPVKSKASVELTSTCYYYADAVILAKAAKLLNKPADAAKYQALATRIKDAFNNKYLDKQKAIYATGLQTELSVPLYWGLVPDDYKAKVAASLAARVAADDYKLDVGLLGTKAILSALSNNGYPDVAYKLAAQRTYPSWGWWIVNGATTLYENWDIQAPRDISLNHIMFGEIGAWLYKGIAGIKPDESAPGYRNVILEPNFVEGLQYFEAWHQGPNGRILSSWKRDGKAVIYKVIVPANSTATLRLKTGKLYMDGQLVNTKGQFVAYTGNGSGIQSYNIAAGTYTFQVL